MGNRFEVKKVTDEGMPFYKVTDTQTGKWAEFGYRNGAESAAVYWETNPEKVDLATWYSPEPALPAPAEQFTKLLSLAQFSLDNAGEAEALILDIRAALEKKS